MDHLCADDVGRELIGSIRLPALTLGGDIFNAGPPDRCHIAQHRKYDQSSDETSKIIYGRRNERISIGLVFLIGIQRAVRQYFLWPSLAVAAPVGVRANCSPSTVMIEFIVTRQGHQSSKPGPQSEVNLFGRLHPDVDVEYLGPVRFEIVFDTDQRALEEDAPD